MKVLHISYGDMLGGADKAGLRLHRALRRNGVDSIMRVRIKTSDEESVVGGLPKSRSQFSERFAQKLSHWRRNQAKCPDGSDLDIAWPASGLGAEINAAECDVVHIHWPGRNWLSIEEIARINKPIVWTMHDCWLVRGGEHYAPSEEKIRWHQRAKLKDQWIRERKKLLLKRHGHIICPSGWMLEQTLACEWTRKWSKSVLVNPIDTEFWRPMNRSESRQIEGLPEGHYLVLFCANNADNDKRKGYSRLVRILDSIREYKGNDKIGLVIAGGNLPREQPRDIPIYALGQIDNDARMRRVYSSCNVAVIPSLVDNLPNVCLEAHSCGVPCISFDLGGTKEAIAHGKTGYVASDGDIEEFANYLSLLANADSEVWVQELKNNCRERAIGLWDEGVVAEKITSIYREVLRA